MHEVPEHLKRYPGAGRDTLAARLSLPLDPFSQDWEWEVAEPGHFDRWLAVYREEPLTDDERFSLMEMLIQCVEDMSDEGLLPSGVAESPQWQALATLLRERPWLHASSIAYWSIFGHDDPEEHFCVSLPMREVWAAVFPFLKS